MSIQYIIGDVFEVMKTLKDDSVDLILTSPPFLALRSYLPADHPDKSKEIGSEATPAEYIDVLLRLTAEWRRLLAPHGSLVVELGDTYSGSGGGGGDYNAEGLQEGQQRFSGSARKRAEHDLGDEYRPSRSGRQSQPPWRGNAERASAQGPGAAYSGGHGWALAKSLTLIPESYRFALAYGINPHTGASSPAGQWRVRNVIRWVRPNPPVGALGDKFRPATSELVVACVSKDRYFDLDAVRGDPEDVKDKRHRTTNGPKDDADPTEVLTANYTTRVPSHPAGAPPLDWWKISPKGFSGSHYAVWPSELCVKPIKAMCPRQVCRTCGEPRRRITSNPTYVNNSGTEASNDMTAFERVAPDVRQFKTVGDNTAHRISMTLDWSDCGHDDWRNGMVLDPFAGTGTTLAVAHGHGRNAIGIDIDSRSAELARDRVGPLFLEIV